MYLFLFDGIGKVADEDCKLGSAIHTLFPPRGAGPQLAPLGRGYVLLRHIVKLLALTQLAQLARVLKPQVTADRAAHLTAARAQLGLRHPVRRRALAAARIRHHLLLRLIPRATLLPGPSVHRVGLHRRGHPSLLGRLLGRLHKRRRRPHRRRHGRLRQQRGLRRQRRHLVARVLGRRRGAGGLHVGGQLRAGGAASGGAGVRRAGGRPRRADGKGSDGGADRGAK
mmetsp:Transcript_45327/g.111180  ORF Transcript_45327/g.111180 Transcript_45327/m.111180 type:complete len:226 (+) Transcript_45327:353-1030(+)